MLRVREECGGQSRIDENDYLVGAPELVVEIAASSVSIDLHEKLRAYHRNGVKEYLTWRTLDDEFDWRVLTAGEFQVLKPDAEGVFSSPTFPGLWLPLKAILKRDSGAVLNCLNAGLRTREHKAFAAKLARRRSRR
jgi:Uma2 family endonuclease